MFWKRNKIHAGSITTKLISLYVIATLIILTIITSLLYWTISTAMQTACQQYVIDELHILHGLLFKSPRHLESIKREVNGVPAELKEASYHYYIKIIDTTGKILLQTPKMDAVVLNAPFPKSQDPLRGSDTVTWHSQQGKDYIIATSPIEFDNNGKAISFAQMALDITYQKELIRNFLKKIFFFGPAAILVIILLSRIIARRGLKQLYDMARLTEDITVNQLSHRIITKEWPKELVPLGYAFNKMFTHIEDAFTRLSQCTTELAHELRTPINNLIGETSVILSRSRNNEDYCRLLESNLEEYQRIASLVENILFLARAEDPRNCLNYSQIKVHEEIAKICDYYGVLADEKNIEIKFTGNGILNADVVLFQRAIKNILDNAFQHTPERGSVVIQIKSHLDKVLKITIQDTGNGIAVEDLNHIFNRFYKAYSQNSYSKGTGLGLAIVNTIMKLHNGEATICSELGKGTAINLVFPL